MSEKVLAWYFWPMMAPATRLDTGQRYVQVQKRRTKADYAEFMAKLVQTHYVGVESVDVIQDNLNTHKYGSFYEHLPLVQARELTRKHVS